MISWGNSVNHCWTNQDVFISSCRISSLCASRHFWRPGHAATGNLCEASSVPCVPAGNGPPPLLFYRKRKAHPWQFFYFADSLGMGLKDSTFHEFFLCYLTLPSRFFFWVFKGYQRRSPDCRKILICWSKMHWSDHYKWAQIGRCGHDLLRFQTKLPIQKWNTDETKRMRPEYGKWGYTYFKYFENTTVVEDLHDLHQTHLEKTVLLFQYTVDENPVGIPSTIKYDSGKLKTPYKWWDLVSSRSFLRV